MTGHKCIQTNAYIRIPVPEARILGMDKEIIPVWGTRRRHQSANKAVTCLVNRRIDIPIRKHTGYHSSTMV